MDRSDTHQPKTHAEKVAWMEAVVHDIVTALPQQTSVGARRRYLMTAINRLAAHADLSPKDHLLHQVTALSLRSQPLAKERMSRVHDAKETSAPKLPNHR